MKSTAGFVLGLIGGIGNILLSVVFAVLSLIIILVVPNLSSTLSSMQAFAFIIPVVFVLVSLWFLVSGILIILFSTRMRKIERVRSGGIWCLVLGIFSLNIFSFIGGIFGIAASGKGEKVADTASAVAVSNYISSIKEKG